MGKKRSGSIGREGRRKSVWVENQYFRWGGKKRCESRATRFPSLYEDKGEKPEKSQGAKAIFHPAKKGSIGKGEAGVP